MFPALFTGSYPGCGERFETALQTKKMFCMAGFLSAASFSNGHEMQQKEPIIANLFTRI